ncbi:uncharacterized protein LOC117787636 [Drosophila innubila]|uniref:uncharacterized protein LOC117787636 n=1 Tax=Drosophila innubila TaxID=198719 RepID=UPI00148BE01B|nr:uncharacterized protein LOC117787636 [Drosophila innubila]
MLPASVSRPYTRLPTPSAMLKSLEFAENTMEESALEFYENCNIAWRAQYTNPALACLSIGNEFQPITTGKREMTSQFTPNRDTDSENNQNGWSCLVNRCRL